jgi:hypothetical protein
MQKYSRWENIRYLGLPEKEHEHVQKKELLEKVVPCSLICYTCSAYEHFPNSEWLVQT